MQNTCHSEKPEARSDAPIPGRFFSRAFLLLLSGFFAYYIGAAVVIDPRGVFQIGRFPVVTLDSRTAKMNLFMEAARKAPVAGVIVGSSRSMQVAPSELRRFTGTNFFNFSVDSARAEDYLAIYRWARKNQTHLKVLLIGLDVEALHNDDEYDARLLTNTDLIDCLGSIKWTTRIEIPLRRVFSTLDRHYAKDMMSSLKLARRSAPAAEALLSGFDEDGLLHYVQWEKQLAAGIFRLEAQLNNSRDEYVRRFDDMTMLSLQRSADLETLVKEARDDGVMIRLWITPLHPQVSSFLAQKTRFRVLLNQTRKLCAELEKKYGIGTFDFSEPRSFGGNDLDWWDGAHINPRNASQLAEKVGASLPSNGF